MMCSFDAFLLRIEFFCGVFYVCARCVCKVCLKGVFACLFIFLVKGVSSPLQHATWGVVTKKKIWHEIITLKLTLTLGILFRRGM